MNHIDDIFLNKILGLRGLIRLPGWQPPRLRQRRQPVPHDQLVAVQRSARGSRSIWLEKSMQWVRQRSGKRGRSQIFSDAALQWLRSIRSAVEQGLLISPHWDWTVPNFSTVGRRQKTLQMHPSATALHLLMDSTGIKFLDEV